MLMPNMSKQDTQLKFKSNSTLNEGDSIKIKLSDANGTAIANQTVNITVTDNDKASDNQSVETNEKGIATLKLDKDAGKYTVIVIYNGNDKYNGCNATKKITVEEKVVQAEATSSQSGPEVDAQGITKEYAIANDMHYLEITVDGDRPGEYVTVGGYTARDSNTGTYHT